MVLLNITTMTFDHLSPIGDRRTFGSQTSDIMDWKGKKVVRRSVFPMFCGSEGSKSRLAKGTGAEPSGKLRNQKLHAAVARTKFGSQNAKSISASEHFWTLRYRKSARRSGVKYMSKSRRTKRFSVRPLLDVQVLKKCTPLWHEAGSEHFWKWRCSKRAPCWHFWTFKGYFSSQAQWILHFAKSERNVRVL